MPLENQIQRGDLNQRLTKALEIKGQKSPVLQLDNTVSAVVLVEDLTAQSSFVEPVRRHLASSVRVNAVAGQTGMLVVSNPAGSGVVFVVERVTARSIVTSQAFLFGLIDPLAVPAIPAGLYFRDRRNVGAPSVRAFSGSDAILRVVNEYMSWNASNAVATPWYEAHGIVIQPGETFGIQGTTANLDQSMAIWGEEILV